MLLLAAREWIAEGEAKGKAEGLHEGQALIDAADLDTPDNWLDRVLDAPTLEAVSHEGISH